MLKKNTATVANNGPSRRRFLARLGIGAAAVTLLSAGLLRRGRQSAPSLSKDFPGPDSIFHPAQDPRTDPRRQG